MTRGEAVIPEDGATSAQSTRMVRTLRFALMDAIIERLERVPATQGELAAWLGITRPRLNRLLKRDVRLFGLDSLAAIACRAGLVVRISASRPYRRNR